MQERSVGDLAEIKSGFTFRDAIKDQESGTLRVLQIRDVRGRSIVLTQDLVRIVWEGKGSPPVLQPDDVVLTSRGEHHTAAIFEGGEPVLPSSQLLVLKVKSVEVLPGYLCWFINHAESARRHIETNLTGSSMPALGKPAVAAMQVQLPSLEVQHRIVAIQRLADEEARLLDELKRNREQLLKAIFKELLEQQP